MKKLILMFIVLFVSTMCYAETWELAVQPYDKEDLPSGHKRAKKGDIIAVKPYPWTWGEVEKKQYLIVIINNLTEDEALALMDPYYEDDAKITDDIAPEITAKRKFKFDLDQLAVETGKDLKLEKFETTEGEQVLDSNNIQLNADLVDAKDLIQNKHTTEWKKAKKK